MDFSDQNIPQLLQYSLPVRFQDMSPSDFEDFIAMVFSDLGYKVEQTNYSGDFGADLLVHKKGRKLAVQIKRYAENNKVSVGDVNQVIGSQSYYKCDGCLVVSTSAFTNPALKLMQEAEVEFWDWDKLQKILCDQYLGGMDVYSFSGGKNQMPLEDTTEFVISEVKHRQEMNRIGSCTLVFAEMTNSGPNAFYNYELPIFISKKNSQVTACYWYEGYFVGGTVYSGSTVELAFIFRSEQVEKIGIGDRFIFNFSRDSGELETHDVKVDRGAIKACYVATMCYGVDSWQYRELIKMRDQHLVRSKIGRSLVDSYYQHAMGLVKLGENCKGIRVVLGFGVAVGAIWAWTINRIGVRNT